MFRITHGRVILQPDKKALKEKRWVERQGKCVEVWVVKDDRKPRKPPTKKPITSFSRQSRMNLIRRIAKTEWGQCLPALFLTLTFPDEVASLSVRERTQLRQSFQYRMEKFLGKKVGCLWRVEWVRRRSGHYKGKIVQHMHLIVSGVRFIHWWWIRKWWQECLGYEGPLQTHVKRVDTALQAAMYLQKYVSKPVLLDYRAYLREGESIGRQWGTLNPSLLPLGVKQGVFDLWDTDMQFLRSMAREKIKDFDDKCPGSFTLFGDEVTENLELWFGDRLDTVQTNV